MLEKARPRARLTLIGAGGTLGFVISLVIHVRSYSVSPVTTSDPLFWVLSVSIFPLFLACFLRMRVWRDPEANDAVNEITLDWRALLPYLPRSVIAVMMGLFVYVVANFVVVTTRFPGVNSIRSGIERSAAQEMATVRVYSGHWLIFYGMPMVFFAFVPDHARPRRRPERPAA